MFKVQPNTTSNRPHELPFLLCDAATGRIIRYSADREDLETHASRLNAFSCPEPGVQKPHPPPGEDPGGRAEQQPAAKPSRTTAEEPAQMSLF